MIGIFPHEDGTVFEFWPVFGSDKGIPKWAKFRSKMVFPDKYWGEYGFAFSGGKKIGDFTLWVSIGISTYPWDIDRVIRTIKRKFR